MKNNLNKIITFLFTVNLIILITANCFSQGAAINTTGTAADASAILDITSDNAGILIPRMTETQKGLIPSPAIGLMIYQTDGIKGFWYYDGTNWVQSIGATGATGQAGVAGVTGATGAVGATGFLAAGTIAGNTPYWDGTTWIVNSSNIFNNGGSVGIGTNNPDGSASLDLGEVSKGLLINRMTTSERNAITNPAEGLQIFNTTNKCFEYYVNHSWEQISCAFECGNVFIDKRDANIYQTVQIDSQCWLKENLKYLPSVTVPGTSSSTIPYYYVYGYNGTDIVTAKGQSNYLTYGVLYNWQAATDACPIGWHLPSDNEWQTLELHLGMDPGVVNTAGWRGSDQGDQLKSTTLWSSGSGNNSSGFSALPSGCRSGGSFNFLSNTGYWWSDTDNGSNAWLRMLYGSYNTVARNANSKDYGFSVRCIKDN